MLRNLCILHTLFIYFKYSSGLEIDHWGTHFVLSFLKNKESPIENVVIITTRERTDVRVSSFGATGQISEISLAAHQSHRISFAEEMMITTFYKVLEKKAVLIESSAKISVYGFSSSTTHNSADGFLVLPIPSLGLEYMAVNLDDKAQLVAIAVGDVTSIKITLKGPNTCLNDGVWTEFADGAQHNFTMDAYDVISMYCETHMTGSLVTSDNPIAILTGNECVSLPSTASCDHVVEMLPPVNQFGDEFVVVPPYGQSHDAILRVVALGDDTTFFIKGSDRVLSAGSYTDFVIIPYDNICFRSSKPVMVVMFMRGPSQSGITYYRGDAFMMYIPPTKKYTTQYVVEANALESYTTYVVVIMQGSTKTTITPSIPDLQPIKECWEYYKDIVPVVGLLHYSSRSVFGVLMYGVANTEAYGYPAGLKLTDYSGVEECSKSPCQNGGWCLEVGLSYRCHCLTRFSGDHCEIDTPTTATLPIASDAEVESTPTESAKIETTTVETTTLSTDMPSRTATSPTASDTEVESTPTESAKIETTTAETTKLSTDVPSRTRAVTTSLTTKEPKTFAMTKPSTNKQATSGAVTTSVAPKELGTSFTTKEPETSATPQKESTNAEPIQEEPTINYTTLVTGAPFKPKPLFYRPPCSDRLCMCKCPCPTKPRSRYDSQPKLAKVVKETLSKTRRLKNSSENVNQSEVLLGASAVIICISYIVFILLLDISNIYRSCIEKLSDYQKSKIAP